MEPALTADSKIFFNFICIFKPMQHVLGLFFFLKNWYLLGFSTQYGMPVSTKLQQHNDR